MILIRTGTFSQVLYRDIHYANVVSLISPIDPVGNNIINSEGLAANSSILSNVVVSSNTSVYGNSLYFANNNNTTALCFPNRSFYEFGINDYTIEFFMNLEHFHPNATTPGVPNYDEYYNGSGLLLAKARFFTAPYNIYYNYCIFVTLVAKNTIYHTAGTGGGFVRQSANLISYGCQPNTWIHIAFTKTRIPSTTNAFYRMFINGVMAANTTAQYDNNDIGSADFLIGGPRGAAGTYYPQDFYGGSIKGYLDEIRLTRNSRYQSDFDVSQILPFANTANTTR